MRITALQPQAHDTERVNIFVDGQFLLGVNALLVYEMSLAVEQELTPQQLEQLRYGEELQQAVERSLNFLSFRPRSRVEIRRYLSKKHTSPEIIAAVLERLDGMEVVNDHDFATFWVENRDHFSPRGAQALKNELRMKGVAREVVDELVDDEQDNERALQAARKKASSLARQPGMDYATFYRRLGSFLQRRGFSFDITKKTVSTFWQELHGDAEAEDFDATDDE
ncbi:MAG TPA: RecX family transcriptional regulator [Ktedonobacteraceae bacterium]|nr:RecX family transcriptional regulator [Ktedonobacteraceae bacterium]